MSKPFLKLMPESFATALWLNETDRVDDDYFNVFDIREELGLSESLATEIENWNYLYVDDSSVNYEFSVTGQYMLR